MFLFEDHLPAGTKPVYLPRANRSIYVASGSVDIHSDNATRYVSEGSALVADEELTLSATEVDSTVWRWELAREAADETAHTLRSAPQTSSELKLTATFELDDRYTWLMRCDTVTFPPGGIAWTHLHQGPGIRITRSGEITIETEGTTQVHGPGSAWAEKGVLPVYAPTTDKIGTTFVRCFLLPKQNKGASSIRFVHPEDNEKINTQKYRVLMERVIVV
ncbi:hypothetical protein AB0H42_29775 [Nocardia sp. NPDC050799]|uniref:hypothetical protein n=1 Tax=Nocardia sp. NPDC050799 TaxID=3154842 RepID=UPI00340C97EE